MLLSVFSAEALGADASGGHSLQNQAGCYGFDEDIGAADVNIASGTTPARQHLAQQRLVETSVEVLRPVSRPARCRHDKYEVRLVRLGVQQFIAEYQFLPGAGRIGEEDRRFRFRDRKSVV